VDTSQKKKLELTIDVPVEDMARMGETSEIPQRTRGGRAALVDLERDHPRLLELVRAHRSTLIFVNSRRGAERLAGAINELAGEPLVRAHHG
jgi:ATP-dependent Lhr-like helicase